MTEYTNEDTKQAWKDLIKRNKTKLCCVATAIITFEICAAISRSANKQTDEFLQQHGLLVAFHTQFEED